MCPVVHSLLIVVVSRRAFVVDISSYWNCAFVVKTYLRRENVPSSTYICRRTIVDIPPPTYLHQRTFVDESSLKGSVFVNVRLSFQTTSLHNFIFQQHPKNSGVLKTKRAPGESKLPPIFQTQLSGENPEFDPGTWVGTLRCWQNSAGIFPCWEVVPQWYGDVGPCHSTEGPQGPGQTQG